MATTYYIDAICLQMAVERVSFSGENTEHICYVLQSYNRGWDISLSIGKLDNRRFDGLLTAHGAEDHSYYPLSFQV
jgi:hypothetical protein